jgi:drug/metabolite transporter (DMT)-like permease
MLVDGWPMGLVTFDREDPMMRASIWFAVLAGFAWGAGGYFEKTGLRQLGMSPLVGITVRTLVALALLGTLSIPAWKAIQHPGDRMAWMMLILGGGVVAGALGMWSFYKALSLTQNLGVTLAIAFAFSPLAGTLVGLIKGDQAMSPRLAVGLLLVIAGIVVVQLERGHRHNSVVQKTSQS